MLIIVTYIYIITLIYINKPYISTAQHDIIFDTSLRRIPNLAPSCPIALEGLALACSLWPIEKSPSSRLKIDVSPSPDEFVNGKDDIPYMKWTKSCLKPPTSI